MPRGPRRLGRGEEARGRFLLRSRVRPIRAQRDPPTSQDRQQCPAGQKPPASGLAGNAKLTNETRLDDALSQFDDYANWQAGAGLLVAESQLRLGYPVGAEVQLIGIVWRVDVTPTGLRAVMLGDREPDWRTELRFPLIQAAVAAHYGYPAHEVEVGYQSLDGSDLDVERYGPESIVEAQSEFADLCNKVRANWGEP